MKKSKRIRIIDNDYSSINGFEHRDAYYEAIDILKSFDSIGHAICFVGLRGTGKSVLLNQIKEASAEYGIKQDEILHLELMAICDGVAVSRDELDLEKLIDADTLVLPTLFDVERVVDKMANKMKVKLLVLDEVTLCRDMIMGGKWFFDMMFAQGTKVVMAGAESASFILANDMSLYTRLIPIDVSYIPFGEYCRVKKLKLDTYEDKKIAMDTYIERGSILDSRAEVDDKYIESAVGINLAISIINSDMGEFIGSGYDMRMLIQSIAKYFTMLGEMINVNGLNGSISRACLSKALNNINAKRNKKGEKEVVADRAESTRIVVAAIGKMYKNYRHKLSNADKSFSDKQQACIDNIISDMGMIYSLIKKPIQEYAEGVKSDDIYLLHGLLYQMGVSAVDEIFDVDNIANIQRDVINEITEKIKSTLYGNILENIVILQFIKDRERRVKKMPKQVTYYNKSFSAGRTGTMGKLCKVELPVNVNGKDKMAEIDLVVEDERIVTLIEIEKSTVADEHQIQWLNNEDVNDYLVKKILRGREADKKVYYLGEPKVVGDISYENIADVLIEHYESYRQAVK